MHDELTKNSVNCIIKYLNVDGGPRSSYSGAGLSPEYPDCEDVKEDS